MWRDFWLVDEMKYFVVAYSETYVNHEKRKKRKKRLTLRWSPPESTFSIRLHPFLTCFITSCFTGCGLCETTFRLRRPKYHWHMLIVLIRYWWFFFLTPLLNNGVAHSMKSTPSSFTTITGIKTGIKYSRNVDSPGLHFVYLSTRLLQELAW